MRRRRSSEKSFSSDHSLVFVLFLKVLFVELLPAELFKSSRILVPHFLMVSIIFVTIYISPKHGIMYGFIFGILFDIVYTEIIGIYLFMFPLIAYITSWIMKILQTNIILVCFCCSYWSWIFRIGVYEMNFINWSNEYEFCEFCEYETFTDINFKFHFYHSCFLSTEKIFRPYAEALRND